MLAEISGFKDHRDPKYTAMHYTTLHYTALHYTTLHYTTLHYTTLHYNPLREDHRVEIQDTLHSIERIEIHHTYRNEWLQTSYCRDPRYTTLN